MYMYIYIQKFISYEFVIKKNTILYMDIIYNTISYGTN